MLELNAALLWLIVGAGLLCLELIGIPGFVVGSAGVAAILTAPVALVTPVAFQWVVWAIATAKLIQYARKLVPKNTVVFQESTEARALKAIPAGQKGRVRYAGSIWDAKCDIEDLSIPAGEDLYVLERRGNILIVIPERLAAGRDKHQSSPSDTASTDTAPGTAG